MSRVKHLFAVALAALMLCLLMPITAFAEEASDGKMLIYAKLPSDWSAPHLWAWADDGTNAFDAWPGGEMEADSNNDGWYYCWIPENTNNIMQRLLMRLLLQRVSLRLQRNLQKPSPTQCRLQLSLLW